MLRGSLFLALIALSLSPSSALASPRPKCTGHEETTACSAAASAADPCCVPRAGLWLFRQRFEPDTGDGGSWGISNVDIMECDGTQPQTPTNSKLSHEVIGSQCARAGIDTEGLWAHGEVGEGVEEVWERVWNTDGRFISSVCDANAATFFAALVRLHESLPTAQWLATKDIIPSADTLYARSDIEAALAVNGHAPVLFCEGNTFSAVVYPVHVVGNLAGFVPAHYAGRGSCPAEGIIYAPSTVLPSPTTSSWDPVYRPTMRPITLSHDANRQVRYDEDVQAKKKKLVFFKQKDAWRNPGEYTREEL